MKLWTLVLLSLVLSSCVTIPISTEYHRNPDNDRHCLESYGGMDGYCSKP